MKSTQNKTHSMMCTPHTGIHNSGPLEQHCSRSWSAPSFSHSRLCFALRALPWKPPDLGGCIGTQSHSTQTHTGTQAHRHTDTQTHSCTGTQTDTHAHRYIEAQRRIDTHAHMHTCTQARRRTGAQAHRRTGAHAGTQAHRHTYTIKPFR